MCFHPRAGRAAAIGRVELESAAETFALIGQFDLVAVGMARKHAVDTAKKPDICLVVELDQREDERAVKIVAVGAILLPLPPFVTAARLDFERLRMLVIAREMQLVVLRPLNRPDVVQANDHFFSVPSRTIMPHPSHRLQ